MNDTPEIAAARIEVERRRARVMATAQELQDRLSPKIARPRARGRAPRRKAPTSPRMRSTRSRARPLAASGVVAAITMFLAREPLIDLAGKLVRWRQAEKRKTRKTPQGQASQTNGDRRMTDRDSTNAPSKTTTAARQRAIEAYDSAREPRRRLRSAKRR